VPSVPPKKRQKLSELSRARADESDYAENFKTITTGPARAAALVAAAALDNALEDAIAADWPGDIGDDDHKADYNLIFRLDGAPLASFAAKIRIAHAMGIYGDVTRGDLLTISTIRNIFAHSPKALDFSHEAIAEACCNLNVSREYAARKLIKKAVHAQSLPRETFLHTCYIIQIALMRYTSTRIEQKGRFVSHITELIRTKKVPVEAVNEALHRIAIEAEALP
jgi:hypothetical protein